MNRRTAVKGMRGVCMAEPVGRYGELDPGSCRRLAHDAQHSQWPHNSAVFAFAGAEDRIAGLRVGTPQAVDEFPDRCRNPDRPGNTSLLEHGHLAAVRVRLQIPPTEAT